MSEQNSLYPCAVLESAEARITPIPNRTMLNLFDYLEDCLDLQDCGHDLRHTEAFLVTEGVAPEPALRWLSRLGGDCDCAILENLELTWSVEDEPPQVSRTV